MVLVLSLGVVVAVRDYYLSAIGQMFPDLKGGTPWLAVVLGTVLSLFVTGMNCWIIRRRINRI